MLSKEYKRGSRDQKEAKETVMYLFVLDEAKIYEYTFQRFFRGMEKQDVCCLENPYLVIFN